MKNRKSTFLVSASALLFGAAMLSDNPAQGQAASPRPSVANTYGDIGKTQEEKLSTTDEIMRAASTGEPSRVWAVLEHGEFVDCLSCISSVEPLLYDSHASNREISAWWLRKRVFGVFGEGEVYQRAVNVLKSDPNPVKRAYAANALGEFLTFAGVKHCAAALKNDPDEGVRVAAALALGRLQKDDGALALAMTDASPKVKVAVLDAASRMNQKFIALGTGLADPDPAVRKRAAEIAETHRASDQVATLIELAKNDADAEVRLSAAHSLGALHDLSARGALEAIAQNDPSGLVRDQARIALRRL